jgi:hypothetical protein
MRNLFSSAHNWEPFFWVLSVVVGLFILLEATFPAWRQQLRSHKNESAKHIMGWVVFLALSATLVTFLVHDILGRSLELAFWVGLFLASLLAAIFWQPLRRIYDK